MSAPNFRTMENFPLFALDTTTEDGEPMEWWEIEELCQDISAALESVNETLLFHKVSVEGGYYFGLQFYVDELHDPHDYDNDDCRYEFDLCRSVAIRRYKGEIGKITRSLRKLARGYGFEELYCGGIFSNGEAVYYRVQNTQRSRVHQAVCAVTV